MKHEVDIDEVVNHLDNGLPNFINAEVFLYALDVTFKIPGVNEFLILLSDWSHLMAFCMDMESGLHCFRKVMLGLMRLSISLYNSGPGVREGMRSWKKIFMWLIFVVTCNNERRAVRRATQRSELPVTSPCKNACYEHCPVEIAFFTDAAF